MLVFKQDSGLLVEGGVCDPPLTDLSEVTHTVWTQKALSCPELTSLFLMESLHLFCCCLREIIPR